jgi:ABC-2 type transport system ATP-binding protein
VVFLDEPMSGLDPMGRYQMREIILSLKTQGKTIFFNSHILSDVEKICDRVAILARGELICIGAIDELLGNTETYRVEGRGGHLNILKKWIPDMEVDDDLWYGHLHGTPKEFISSLSATGGQLIGMNLAKPTLEEFFMQQLQERGIYSSG